jgi:hypothetical protein
MGCAFINSHRRNASPFAASRWTARPFSNVTLKSSIKVQASTAWSHDYAASDLVGQ